jgi:U3 small nucleolar RNA-associated protein 4
MSSEAGVRVHRCRFTDYEPSGILALAYNTAGTRLALARGNGNIEVWNVEESWFNERVIPGSGEGTIQSLMWAPDPKDPSKEQLLSAGLSGRINLWDLTSLLNSASVDSHGGAVWKACLSPSRKSLVAACEDGTLRLFQVNDASSYEQGPVYVKSFSSHSGRALSVCWPRENIIVSGGSDSMIRVWNVSTRQNTSYMAVERVKEQPTMVWALDYLADGTIVSGDSLGHVQFWDMRSCTLLQSFDKHKADVLALVASDSDKGPVAYAAGVDNTIAQFKRVFDPKLGAAKWVLTTTQRPHTHDVLALALSPTATRRHRYRKEKTVHTSVRTDRYLVSGGVDTKLSMFLNSKFERKAIKISPFPNKTICSVATAPGNIARLMIYTDQKIDLFQFNRGVASSTHAGHQHILQMNVNAQSSGLDDDASEIEQMPGLNLCSAVLSPDSRWIACGDPLEVKLFELTYDQDDSTDVDVTRYDIKDAFGANVMKFTPDSQCVILGTFDGTVLVYSIREMRVLKTFHPLEHMRSVLATEEDSDDEEIDSILFQTLDISEDGQWLAVGDAENRICIFNLDSLTFSKMLPTLEAPHIYLKYAPFSPERDHAVLVIGLTTNQFFLYNVEANELSAWSQNNPLLPAKYVKKHQKVYNATFDPSKPFEMLLQAHSYMTHVDFKQKALPDKKKPVAAAQETAGKRGKRKSSAISTNDAKAVEEEVKENFRVIDRFKPTLFSDFIGPRELVVVETPWVNVMRNLPDAFFRTRYGT